MPAPAWGWRRLLTDATSSRSEIAQLQRPQSARRPETFVSARDSCSLGHPFLLVRSSSWLTC
eukprot:222575-Chlamydomonas_euryale.AAC.9